MMNARKGALVVTGIIFGLILILACVAIGAGAQTPPAPKAQAKKTDASQYLKEAQDGKAPTFVVAIPADDSFTAELEKTKALAQELDDLKRESGVTALEQRLEAHGTNLRAWMAAHKIPDGWTYDAASKSFVAPPAAAAAPAPVKK